MATIIIRIELHRQVANRLFKNGMRPVCSRKLGRLASQYTARPAALACTVKKGRLKRPFTIVVCVEFCYVRSKALFQIAGG